MNGHGAVSALEKGCSADAHVRRGSCEPIARGGWRLILRNALSGSSEAPREGDIHNGAQPGLSKRHARKKNLRAQVLNKICTQRPHFFHNPRRSKVGSTGIAGGYNRALRDNFVIPKLIGPLILWLAMPGIAAAADAMLFELYLTDGTSIVSYGEFARVDDRVVFSLVMGGTDQPRLHAATLPASAIDWARTQRQAASTRYQWYAQARGEEDFTRLSNEVASVINAVVVSQDRNRALQMAQRARATVAQWSRTHFGYRQQEVGEILGILDQAISDLRASAGVASFDVALVATTPVAVALEPLASMPSTRQQIDQAMRVSVLTGPAERIALLQAVLQLIADAGSVIPSIEAASLRRLADTRIRTEQVIDLRYSAMSSRLMNEATRGATRASIADVQRVLDRIPREDTRLGRRRPDVVQALQASVQAQLGAARHLRLRRDQWMIRRSLYAGYQRSVGGQLLQLVKSQPALEAIRRLDGPPPEVLVTLNARLKGGAARLERIQPPADLRTTHELLLGAWRFAETAVNGRYEAARNASVNGAWEASSSAAGALLLLSRAQEELRTLLEPPRLP